MAALPRALPGMDADPGAVRETGEMLLAASSRLDDAGSFAAGSARLPDWHGSSAAAYRSAVGELRTVADARSLALRGVAQRVLAHADTLEELVAEREWLGSRRATLVQAANLGTDAAAVAAFDADVVAWARRRSAAEAEVIRTFRWAGDLGRVEARFTGAVDPADEALKRAPLRRDPARVAAWWRSLTPEERTAVIAAAPELGLADGLTAAGRDLANTLALLRDLALWRLLRSRGVITPEERAALRNAEAVDDALDDPDRQQLYLYAPDAFGGDGAVAIGVDDLDSADDVAIVVPGFGTDATSIGDQVHRAETILHETDAAEAGDTDAVLAWIGYDAPDNLPWKDGDRDALGVVSEDAATSGGRRLADTVEGLRASREGDPAHLTGLGFSYGSTTLGHAAHDHHLDVDDLIFVGSPGVGDGLEHAGQTGLDPSHVWVGANSRDPITFLGSHGSLGLDDLNGAGLGHDPAEDRFGGVRFGAESDPQPHYPEIGAHLGYFDPGSESLGNIGAIINGDYDDVDVVEHRYDPWWGPPEDPEG